MPIQLYQIQIFQCQWFRSGLFSMTHFTARILHLCFNLMKAETRRKPELIKIKSGNINKSFYTLLCRHAPGWTHLCSFQHVLLDNQHVLVGQTDEILAPLSDSERLIADWLPFARPGVTRLRLLLRLTTQEVSRQLHQTLIRQHHDDSMHVIW